MKKILPMLMLFIAVMGIFFLPVSTVLMHDAPLDTAFADAMRTSSEKDDTKDFRSTDITPFTNREYVFYVPPAYMIEMSNFGYLDDCWYWNGNDDNGVSYAGGGPRGNDMYTPIANCSTIMISVYERDAHVKVEWMNATALKCNYDEYYGWSVETGAKVVWASDIPSIVGNNVTLHTKWEYDIKEFNYLEIPIIEWEVAPGWHILSGSVRITSDVPISVMHHKLKPGAATDAPDDHYASAWWNGLFAGYGEKLMVRVAGDLWISALEAPTHVKVIDMSDRDDDASFTLDRFEGWEYTRNPILQQEGFDDDLVLISADHPVSVVGGIESMHAFTQVYGLDGKNYLFPCFSKVMVYAPEDVHIILEDNSGNQGSWEGDMKAGETRLFDFKVLYKLRCYASFEWAHLRSSKPVMVYTLGDHPWTLDPTYTGTIAGEDYLTTYRESSLGEMEGTWPHPADTDFNVPIRSRSYVTVQNLGAQNKVKVDFSELSLPLTVDLPAYSSMTMEISENSYEYLDLEGQYQRETDAFWSNKNHPFVYKIVVDNNKREEVFLTWDNITKGTTLKVTAEKDVMVFVDYNRDYQTYATGIDLIPGLESPAPRGIPAAQPMVVALGGAIVAMDVLFVMGGHRPLIDQLKKWRN
jgi:hypothetical protein